MERGASRRREGRAGGERGKQQGEGRQAATAVGQLGLGAPTVFSVLCHQRGVGIADFNESLGLFF